MSFLNPDADCTVYINGGNTPIPCPAGVGFAMDDDDAPITSFIVIENGISYKWVGKY
jgi:hypothetical protein